jgi:hypothetical protein
MSRLPRISIGPVEGGHAGGLGGVLVTCSRCPNVRVIRTNRQAADRYAKNHLAGHGYLMAAATGDLEDLYAGLVA